MSLAVQVEIVLEFREATALRLRDPASWLPLAAGASSMGPRLPDFGHSGRGGCLNWAHSLALHCFVDFKRFQRREFKHFYSKSSPYIGVYICAEKYATRMM